MATIGYEHLNTGVDEIDHDHARLMWACTTLRDAVSGDAARRPRAPDDPVGAAVESLRALARYHFLREEGLMADHGYPDLDDHRRQHAEFLGLLDRLAASDPATGPAALDEASLDALEQWLVEHIEGGDNDYVVFFRMRGGA